MFSDVDEDNVHADAINCIAYYGVTVGKGDGTYAPDEHVSAFQMGLFVQRAADLMDADGEAALDGVELSDTVTRLEMAKLMFALVDDIRDDVRINRDGDYQVQDDDGDWQDVDDFFADAKAEVPIADSDLIGATYELGITRGTSVNVSTPDSTFAPSDPVTRAQMASFLTRAMDHSNVRPEGLAIQRNNNEETQVSYRDADFAPIEDARIDVFSTLYPDDAFDEDDGECESRFVKDETPSFDACEIDIGDGLTDDDGNVTFELDSDADPITAECVGGGEFEFETATGSPDERTFWAWTGSLGDELDEDTVRAELEAVDRPVGADPADHLDVSGGLPTSDEIAKMGETVTFTAQLQTDGDDAIGPDRSRNPYHVRIQKFFINADAGADGTNPATDFTVGYVYLDTSALGGVAAGTPFQTPFDSLMFPNADGEFTVNLTNPDGTTERDDLDVGARATITPFDGNDDIDGNLLNAVGDVDVDGDTNHGIVSGRSAVLWSIFSDDDPRIASVSGESTTTYRIARAGSTANSVTVSVTDQYGDGFRNAGITVTSTLDAADADDDNARYPEEVDVTVQDNEDGDDNGTDGESGDDVSGTFDTRRNGTYRIGYNYTDDEPVVEEITPSVAAVAAVLGDNPETTATEDDFELEAARDAIPGSVLQVFWANTGTSVESDHDDDNTVDLLDVLVADVDSRAIVVDESDPNGNRVGDDLQADELTPMVYYYDEEDTFIVGGIGATFEMFEEALADGNPAQVQWESYEFDRPRDRAVWELTLNCDD